MEIPYNSVVNQDCIEFMKQLPDDAVDITITSPPYNIVYSCRGTAGMDAKDRIVKMYEGGYEDDLSQEGYFEFIDSVVGELIRVNKWYTFFNFQFLINNRYAYMNLIHKYQKNIKDIIGWAKSQVQPAIQPTALSSNFELILVFTKEELAKKRSFEKAYFNNRKKGQTNQNFIYGANAAQEKNDSGNKAVYPEYLVEWFVSRFTEENDVVFDPFLGSGTTAVVAKKNGRRYLGCELSPEFYAYATKRIDNTGLDTRLFEPLF